MMLNPLDGRQAGWGRYREGASPSLSSTIWAGDSSFVPETAWD